MLAMGATNRQVRHFIYRNNFLPVNNKVHRIQNSFHPWSETEEQARTYDSGGFPNLSSSPPSPGIKYQLLNNQQWIRKRKLGKHRHTRSHSLDSRAFVDRRNRNNESVGSRRKSFADCRFSHWYGTFRSLLSWSRVMWWRLGISCSSKLPQFHCPLSRFEEKIVDPVECWTAKSVERWRQTGWNHWNGSELWVYYPFIHIFQEFSLFKKL